MEEESIIEKIMQNSNEIFQSMPSKYRKKVKKRLKASLFVSNILFGSSFSFLCQL